MDKYDETLKNYVSDTLNVPILPHLTPETPTFDESDIQKQTLDKLEQAKIERWNDYLGLYVSKENRQEKYELYMYACREFDKYQRRLDKLNRAKKLAANISSV